MYEIDDTMIDHILNEVIARGFNENVSDCDDYAYLLRRKEFKDLIVMEIYECYFWEDRHEFDLQLLNELVENVSRFFQDPNTIIQIKTGFLVNGSGAVVIGIVKKIWEKFKTKTPPKSGKKSKPWRDIEKNTKKIGKMLQKHNYVLTDKIESILGVRREDILPILKLCGCKCYKRSIWIAPGLPESKVKEILRTFKIKYR